MGRGGLLTVAFFAIFFLSLLFSFVLTRYVRDFASRRGWVAVPSQERHLHSTPLPRLGGVAIFISFSLGMLAAALMASYIPYLHSAVSLKTLLTILVPACLVFLLGVYDDLYSAGPYVKFAVQALAATMLFLGGLRILNIPVLFGNHQLPWFLGLPLTILWVLAITNAFNLIDGLDGLAAGSALFSTLVAFVVALLNGYSLVTVMTIALAGAILGFLRTTSIPRPSSLAIQAACSAWCLPYLESASGSACSASAILSWVSWVALPSAPSSSARSSSTTLLSAAPARNSKPLATTIKFAAFWRRPSWPTISTALTSRSNSSPARPIPREQPSREHPSAAVRFLFTGARHAGQDLWTVSRSGLSRSIW